MVVGVHNGTGSAEKQVLLCRGEVLCEAVSVGQSGQLSDLSSQQGSGR